MSARVGFSSGAGVVCLLAALLPGGCGNERPPYVDNVKASAGGSVGDNDDDEPVAGGGNGDDDEPVAGAGKSSSATAGKAGKGGTTSKGGSSGNGGSSGVSGISGAPPLPDGKVFALHASNIYLWGTLVEGSAGWEAIANHLDPNVYLVGFNGADNRSGTFSGDTLVYQSHDVTRKFAPDGAWTRPAGQIAYPTRPEEDDPIVETPGCDAGSAPLFNAEGRMIYICYVDGDYAWFDGGEKLFVAKSPDTTTLLALGAGNVVLGKWPGFYTLDLTAPETKHPVTAITNPHITIRGHGDGFRVVENDDNVGVLWQVSPDGSAEKLGVYPDVPPGISPTFLSGNPKGSVIGPDDALYTMSYHNLVDGPQGDVIVRRTIEGVSEIVYDEVDAPRLKIHISALVTGP